MTLMLFTTNPIRLLRHFLDIRRQYAKSIKGNKQDNIRLVFSVKWNTIWLELITSREKRLGLYFYSQIKEISQC